MGRSAPPAKLLATERVDADELDALESLPQAFYQDHPVKVAKRLLGKGLLVAFGKHTMLCEIHETEAYLGSTDPASHAFRGPTPRTLPMFEEGGACYVYLSYGVNYCMNVVTGPKGRAEAVLLRAAAPCYGLEAMARHRNMQWDGSLAVARKLLSGPGKLCHALGIGPSQNGWNFFRPDFRLVDLRRNLTSRQILATPRIGITKAKHELYRFVVKDSIWLSR